MDLEKNSFEILNVLSKPILLIDRNYHIIGVNREACKSFCLPLEKIVGQGCFKITHKLDRPCWKKEIPCPAKQTFELKERSRVIHRHIYGDNAVFEEVIATPLFYDQGEVNFIVEELMDITELIQSKEIMEHLKNEISTLRGIIPICSSCKKVRDDKGYWQQVEAYVRTRSEAEFSHGICPECMKKLYPDFVKK